MRKRWENLNEVNEIEDKNKSLSYFIICWRFLSFKMNLICARCKRLCVQREKTIVKKSDSHWIIHIMALLQIRLSIYLSINQHVFLFQFVLYIYIWNYLFSFLIILYLYLSIYLSIYEKYDESKNISISHYIFSVFFSVLILLKTCFCAKVKSNNWLIKAENHILSQEMSILSCDSNSVAEISFSKNSVPGFYQKFPLRQARFSLPNPRFDRCFQPGKINK